MPVHGRTPKLNGRCNNNSIRSTPHKHILLHYASNPWCCTVATARQKHYRQWPPHGTCARASSIPSDVSVLQGQDVQQPAAPAPKVQPAAALHQQGLAAQETASITSSETVSTPTMPDAHKVAADRLHGCPQCNSTGRVPCKECEGRGFLKRGGYMKKNPLNMSRIIGSKWTAMEETMGWRHFRVIQQRKLGKQTPFLLLQASCDHNVQLWVNAQMLRDRSAWAAGWLQMSEVQGLGLEIQGSRGLKCQACSGLGYKPCVACDGTGRAELIVL